MMDGAEPGWTPRQREVLDLLADGRTNWQIAETLGISLEGAKYHVREVVAKLGVDSREAAAEYWRRKQALRGRLAGWLAVTGESWRWIAAAAGGAVLVAGAVWLAAALWPGGSTDDAVSPGETPAPSEKVSTPTVEPSAIALPLPAGTRLAWALPGFVGGPMQTEVAMPLDARDPEAAVVLERLAGWLETARVLGPVDDVPIPSLGDTLEVGLDDGRHLRLLGGQDCMTVAGGFTCTAVDSMVGLVFPAFGEPGQQRIRFEAPELEDWMRTGWRSDVEMGSSEESWRRREALLGR
ncbi:MAG: helix-turn-helix transcriptional regulator [Dehalococcoidia bacterium]|nr:helix-turn-helix transcriptional regulator [Dehalococcoidia bacterium]